MSSERKKPGSLTGRARGEQAGDIICLSHLRWNFVYQRPQHLLSRFVKGRRVFFFEEPVVSQGQAWVEMKQCPSTGVRVVIPHIPPGTTAEQSERLQNEFLFQTIASHKIRDYILWYYTAMALSFTRELSPRYTVYDCMDELSAFRGAPPELMERERELMERADLVFTGGRTLYEAKKDLHWNIHPFPSSVDTAHFAQGRNDAPDPEDQAGIPRPRFGYCGVIDERMDLELLDGLAKARPDWQFIMIGPIVKIDAATLPAHANIHYLGGKPYAQLPAYIGNWDVAMLPFARNDSTRYISPTKTPEYLAAGRPAISTSIQDVISPYGELGLAAIADSVEDFIAAGEGYLSPDFDRQEWLQRADAFLAENSWDATWSKMNELIEAGMARKSGAATAASAPVGESAPVEQQFVAGD